MKKFSGFCLLCMTALLAVSGCKSDEKTIEEPSVSRITAENPDLLPVGGGNLN